MLVSFWVSFLVRIPGRAFFSLLCSMVSMVIFLGTAQAANINWSGLYRAEGIETHNLELGSAEQTSSYGLHHLILRPSVVPADGFILRSRFDIFNSPAYPGSQVGQFFGAGPRGPTGKAPTNTTSARDSNTLARNEASDTLAVNELYLTWTHEFGSLLVGRAPLQFGLGMSYSAGDGDFDHWFDNRDMIAYKMNFGNVTLMPMIGKMSKGAQNGPLDGGSGGDLGHNGDVNDYMMQLQYDNAETGTSAGIFYLNRIASRTGNDTPAGANGLGEIGGADSVNLQESSFKQTQWNVFFAREFKEFKGAIEAGFINGSAGVKTANTPNATQVGMASFGVASEWTYKPTASNYTWMLKTGVASGDQAGTPDQFEAFYFNRNYDVADLLFNHPLGLEDFLRTQPLRGNFIPPNSATGAPARALTGSQVVDTETVSNAFYIAPSVARRFGDRWSMDTRVVYAFLHSGPLKEHPVDQDLGYEWDIAATYKPIERLSWRSGLSFLFPGRAFEGGDLGYESKFAWGIYTKAALRF